MTATAIAIVGTGGIADAHARAYATVEDCEMLACADLVPERAREYADEHDVPAWFEDHGEMLEATEPDLVSVCTPESTHADIVVDIARQGIVDGIHCEKIMDATWGGATLMARVCRQRDVQLTVNHQRRFGDPWRDAKERIDAGEIGRVERVSFSFADLFTYGTHSTDLCGLFAGDVPADWVLGQIHYDEENVHRGSHVENGSIATWEYENGVYGLATTGQGQDLVDAHNRVEGTDGVLEVRKRFHDDGSRDHALAIRREGDAGWTVTTYGETGGMSRAVADVVDALGTDRTSPLGARNALNATEIPFAIYESSRRRGRVDCPLRIDDNPLEAMVAEGAIGPDRTRD